MMKSYVLNSPLFVFLENTIKINSRNFILETRNVPDRGIKYQSKVCTLLLKLVLDRITEKSLKSRITLRPILTFFFLKNPIFLFFPTNQIAPSAPDKSETGCAIPAGGVAIVSIGRAA